MRRVSIPIVVCVGINRSLVRQRQKGVGQSDAFCFSAKWSAINKTRKNGAGTLSVRVWLIRTRVIVDGVAAARSPMHKLIATNSCHKGLEVVTVDSHSRVVERTGTAELD